jgi:septal ring factor EnvC (AmiA/AmiB activator)
MAFEEVNVSLIKNSINNSLTSINYNSSKEILDKITNNDVWSTASRDNFKKALSNLVNVKYKELEEKLNSLLLITNKIEEYQELAKLNAENQTKLNEINLKISELENELDSSSFQEEIEGINSSILENETKMEVIINTINNNL